MSTRYVFRHQWWVPHPPALVAEVLVDLAQYPRWWPQVLAVAALGPDEARVLCRSRLPYTLDLVLRAESRELPRLQTSVQGDLAGFVRWLLQPDGAGTEVLFEQEVEVTSGLLRMGSRVAKPLLAWNHRQMMLGCRSGLAARLDTLGAATPAS